MTCQRVLVCIYIYVCVYIYIYNVYIMCIYIYRASIQESGKHPRVGPFSMVWSTSHSTAKRRSRWPFMTMQFGKPGKPPRPMNAARICMRDWTLRTSSKSGPCFLGGRNWTPMRPDTSFNKRLTKWPRNLPKSLGMKTSLSSGTSMRTRETSFVSHQPA